jgi:hypothetical protein
MRTCLVGLLLVLLLPAWAPAYVVLNLNDSGPNSLRWCIEQANAHSGSDTIIFDAALAGGTIFPLTQLPTLTGYYGDTVNARLHYRRAVPGWGGEGTDH